MIPEWKFVFLEKKSNTNCEFLSKNVNKQQLHSTISEKLINKPGDIMGLVRPDWVDSDDSEELDCFL